MSTSLKYLFLICVSYCISRTLKEPQFKMPSSYNLLFCEKVNECIKTEEL